MGHDVVRIRIWSHHLILPTPQGDPLPFIVPTPLQNVVQILPLQLPTPTSQCAVTCAGPPPRASTSCMSPVHAVKQHFPSAHSTQVQALVDVNLLKTSPFSPLHYT